MLQKVLIVKRTHLPMAISFYSFVPTKEYETEFPQCLPFACTTSAASHKHTEPQAKGFLLSFLDSQEVRPGCSRTALIFHARRERGEKIAHYRDEGDARTRNR